MKLAIVRVRVLGNLLYNHFLSGEFQEGEFESGWKEKILLLLNVSVFYNWISYLALLLISKLNDTPGNQTRRIGATLLRSGCLHAGLRYLSPESRAVVSKLTRGERHSSNLAKWEEEAVEAVRNNGFSPVSLQMKEHEIATTQEYFRGAKGFASQVVMQSNGKRITISSVEENTDCRHVSFSDNVSLKCPPIYSLVESNHLKRLADAYVGFSTLLYSVNTFITLPGKSTAYVFRKHRDYDDFASVAFFIYWTSVSAENGATIYYPKTHLKTLPDAKKVVLAGNAGNIYMLDGFGLHAGNSQIAGSPRLVTWLRYGSIPNLSTIQNKNGRFFLELSRAIGSTESSTPDQ